MTLKELQNAILFDCLTVMKRKHKGKRPEKHYSPYFRQPAGNGKCFICGEYCGTDICEKCKKEFPVKKK